MRIHLGHHFYGAGNLGDDFMLAGFLAAMRSLAPDATFTAAVPFPLEPLQRRFPAIAWLPYDPAVRAQAIADCDGWLGLGGSPFQQAQSRWFVDHLTAEAAFCAASRKRMYYLGVGVQTTGELADLEVQRLCGCASGIWTRDAESAQRLSGLRSPPPIHTGADLAHVFFRELSPPPPMAGRVTLVPNFDFGAWPGQAACLQAINRLPLTERVWLAQESRPLPGAEHSLFAAIPAPEQARWRFISPEQPGAPLSQVLGQWPTGEWLVTARYHAALAGAWAGSKVVVLATNEKLRAAANALGAPTLSPEASESAVSSALAAAQPSVPPHDLARRAFEACAGFLANVALVATR